MEKFNSTRGGVVSFLIALLLTFSLVTGTAFANAKSDTHNKRGDGHFHVGDYQDALEEYTLAISIDDKVAIYFSNRGWTYFCLKNYNAAKADFDTAILLDEKLANAYRGRAELYNAQSNFDSSKEDFYKAGSLYYDSDNYSEAAEDFTKAIEADGTNATYYASRGWAYYKLKRFTESEKDFNTAIRLSNDSIASAYEGRAYVYRDTEKFDSAKNDFCSAVEKYYNEGNYEAAKSCLKLVMPMDDDSPRVLFWAGMIANDVDKNYNKSVEIYSTLIGKLNNPYQPAVTYRNRGEGYLHQENFDAAVVDFSKAIELDSNDIFSYKKRADIYFYHTKDYSNAFADYKEVLRLDETQKFFTDEERDTIKKNIDICWDSFSVFKRFQVKLYYPEYKLQGLFFVLFVIMLVDLIFELIGNIRDPRVTESFGLFIRGLIGKIFLLFLTDMVGIVDRADPNVRPDILYKIPFVNGSIRNFFLLLIILYQTTYTINNLKRAGVPVPDWLYNLVKSIINMIEGRFPNNPPPNR